MGYAQLDWNRTNVSRRNPGWNGAIRGVWQSISRVRLPRAAMRQPAGTPFPNLPAFFRAQVPRYSSCPYRWTWPDPAGSSLASGGSPAVPFRKLSPVCLARNLLSRDEENPFLDSFRRLAIALRLVGYSQPLVLRGNSQPELAKFLTRKMVFVRIHQGTGRLIKLHTCVQAEMAG